MTHTSKSKQPNHTTKHGAHIRDAVDLKRTMITVILALLPALFYGIYNTGYQYFSQLNVDYTFVDVMLHGSTKIVPMIAVSYIVGLAIEFAFAVFRGHEVNEGYLVTGLLIPMIMPVDIPLWMVGLSVAFAVFIGGLIVVSLRAKNQDDPFVSEACDEVPNDVPTKKAVLWLIVGMVLLPVSSHFLVGSAVDIAKYFGLSDLVIGLTIIAIGTSLPELAASVAGVLKNEDDLALGNIVGSNIFNILAVLPLAGIINPSVVDPSLANRDILIMLGATLALIIMSLNFRGSQRINRVEGGLLLIAFLAYQGYIFSQVG